MKYECWCVNFSSFYQNLKLWEILFIPSLPVNFCCVGLKFIECLFFFCFKSMGTDERDVSFMAEASE